MDELQQRLPELVSMAWFLLGDPVLVTEAMVRTVRAVGTMADVAPRGIDGGPPTLTSLLYRCCAEVAGPRPAAQGRGPDEPSPASGGSRDEERSALALVALGGLPYSDAAEVLGADAASVADWLRSGLHRVEDHTGSAERRPEPTTPHRPATHRLPGDQEATA